MTQKSLQQKLQANKGRVVLIMILVAVLGYAIFDAAQSGEEPVVAEETTTAATTKTNVPARNETVNAISYDRFPVCEQNDWLQYNPFRFDGLPTHPDQVFSLPDSDNFIDTDDEEMVEEQATPDTYLPVEIILESSRGRVAMYGEEFVREGQVTEDGQVIQRIGDDRIILRKELTENDEENPYP